MITAMAGRTPCEKRVYTLPLNVATSLSPKYKGTWSFHVVVLQRTAKKCTKIQNARAHPLFCSLNLLFGVALVTVAVGVC